MNVEEHIYLEIKNSLNIDLSEVQPDFIKEVTEKLVKKGDLSENETIIATIALMSDAITHEQIAAYLSALHQKGETEIEIAASAKVMRIFATKIATPSNQARFDAIDIVDCCGTGGGINLFNISTVASIILAAGGLYVAKHGNRAITSQSGSADFLEAIGVRIDCPPDQVGECILKNHIGFLFAPLFHKATKNVQQVRRKLPHKTIFNILGPLTNPALPSYQIIGVYDQSLTEKIARVLALLGLKRACVFYGLTPCGGGMDEVSILGQTQISELATDGTVTTRMFDLSEVGFKVACYEDLRTGKADELAPFLLDILRGKVSGPEEEIVALNAAFGFVTAQKVSTIAEGIALARELMSGGACDEVIENWITFTRTCSN
jgi:anthranilate phosphoribosyltransferase